MLQIIPVIFLLFCGFYSSHAHNGCLLENLTVSYDHRSTHFTHNGEVLPILLEGSGSSYRPFQDFLNNIVMIIGTEVIGYTDISIVDPPEMHSPTETSYALSRLSGCLEPSCDTRFPTAPAINMAMWMSDPIALEGWPTSGESGVMSHGNHVLYGRYGWYVSNDIVHSMWEASSIVGDHWRSFQDSQYISALSVSGNIISESESTDEVFSYCNHPECMKGIFYPPWCNNATMISAGASHSDCALLLADYSDLSFHMVTSQILELHLNVKVGWVGPNLHYMVTRLVDLQLPVPDLSFHMVTSQILELHLNVKVGWVGPNLHYMVTRLVDLQLPVLFFTMSPNDLLHYSSFARVAFPSCPLPEETEGDISIGSCDSLWHPITKMVWSAINENAPPLSVLIQNICIDDQLAEHIFQSYLESGDKDMDHFACQWLMENPDVWLDWMPADSLSVRRQLYLPGLFPTIDESDELFGIYYGATMAIQAINKDSDVLSVVELKMLPYGTMCEPDITLDVYSNIMQDNTKPLAGFLGPACSTECDNLSGFSKYFNQVIISYFAESESLAAKDRHPFVFRVFPDSQQVAYATEEVFDYFGWTDFALVREDGLEGEPLVVADYLMMSGMECVYCPDSSDDQRDAQETVYVMKAAEPEVILLHTSERLAQELLCEAFQQDLFIEDGYMWVVPSWYHTDWWDVDNYNLSDVIGCSTSDMKTAVSGSLSLTRVDLAEPYNVIAGGITMSDWESAYNDGVGQMNTSFPVLALGAYAYDAVWTFALSLQKLIDLDSTYLDSIDSDQTSVLFREFLQNTSFSGATGQVEFIQQDRRGPVTILVNLLNSGDPHQEVLGQYIPTPASVDEGELYVDDDVIDMMKEQFYPFNVDHQMKTCAIEGIRLMLGSSCASAFVVVCLLFTLIFLIMALGLGFLFKKKYDMKVKEAQRRMKKLGLLSLGMDSLATLDEWEMMRENVILNRKLGEGAFGTVYGGQALLDGQTWDAVAVKTLKMGSSIEEKLDFLSEAEMMKRFEHKNIVRLRAVCTHGEPLYAVMDFMLYGDLKTFLLARRHLVGQQCIEAEVLHPSKLTAMLHDIVSGLDYLANNKYVHRDLACRNCLVDSSYSVMIGDFGMTRPLYDSDYYRFCKQGKLPIRWMAPESVSEGLFTLMSDIWSLGIVIYEIVTFGGFPYPEMSNAVVLEYIKDCNSMTPPDNCPTMLSSLMMQCWVIEPSMRPMTSDILVQLESNPELIVPCISKPHEVVSVDGLSSGSSFTPVGWSSRASFCSTDQLSQGSSIRLKSSIGSLRRALENSFSRKKPKHPDRTKVSQGLWWKADMEMGQDCFMRQEHVRQSNRSEPTRSSMGSKNEQDYTHESIQRYASFDGVLESPTRKVIKDDDSFESISKKAQSFDREHHGQECKHRVMTKLRSDSAPLIPKSKRTSLRKNRSRSIGTNECVRRGVVNPTGGLVGDERKSNVYVTSC